MHLNVAWWLFTVGIYVGLRSFGFGIHVAAEWYDGSLKSEIACVPTPARDEGIHVIPTKLISGAAIQNKVIRRGEGIDRANPEGFVCFGRTTGLVSVFHYEEGIEDELLALFANGWTEQNDWTRCQALKERSPFSSELVAVAVSETFAENPRVSILRLFWFLALPDRSLEQNRSRALLAPSFHDVRRRFPFAPEH
jgi:hypothetical protein